MNLKQKRLQRCHYKDDTMSIGTEHEYSINNRSFKPLPVSDLILERISGRIQNETPLGEIIVSKELQKHVLEIVPRRPGRSLAELERVLHAGIQNLYSCLTPEFQLLGLGMHPLLTLDMTTVWDHDEREIYEVYDRLFNIHQHGWLNIQALQINIPYASEEELVTLYNKIRSIIPYVVAITTASPFVEGKSTGTMDNRLIYYRKNQERIPSICHGLIPEPLQTLADYHAIHDDMCRSLMERGGEALCREWVNSRGVIVRFSRCCLEIKAIDEQECIHADMAVTAFVLSLLRCRDLPLEKDQDALLALTEEAIAKGTEAFRQELEKLYDLALQHATEDQRRYLPHIKRRIEKGSLAELLSTRYKSKGSITPLLRDLEYCLRENIPYI